MNQHPEEFKRIPAEQLRSFSTACLQAAGMTDQHAAQLAGLLTNSDLRGVRSHGTRALFGYCRSIHDKSANPDPDIQILAETCCHIGHYGSAGHYVRRAMEQDCTAFSVQAAYPQYYTSNEGKRAAHYGNPPLCFGLPGQQGPPVVLDVATCILADYQRGEEIEAIEEQIPAAFFKSMGYTAIATLLGGAFVVLYELLHVATSITRLSNI